MRRGRSTPCRLKAVREQLSAAFFKTGAAANSIFFSPVALLCLRYSWPAARNRKMWLFCRYTCLRSFVPSLQNDGNSDGLRNIVYSCFRFPLFPGTLSGKSRSQVHWKTDRFCDVALIRNVNCSFIFYLFINKTS